MAVPLLAAAVVVMAAWNILTDWVWISDSLGVLTTSQAEDLQKRALTITKHLDSAKNIVYAAQKQYRKITAQEAQLIKSAAEQATREINELEMRWDGKFYIGDGAKFQQDLKNTIKTLRLQIHELFATAGLVRRQEVKAIKVEGVVEVVFDGDTIKLTNGDTVRLVGIDAPESTTEAGEVSKKYLKELLTGKSVRVESDPNIPTDMYGRRLGIVYLADVNVNIEMLKKGLAVTSFFEPNALVFEKQWKAAEDEAKKKKTSSAGGTSAGSGGTGGTATNTGARVFTGIVSQGTLGAGLTFVARPDDLITSMAELQEAAQNNLAAYLLALPSKIVYEVKIVSQVITASGFTQRGATQQIVSSYLKDGTPRYKTVTNKFATLTLYFMTDKGARSKIGTIVLGPTDAVKLNPSIGQLAQLEGDLQNSITTIDIADVKTIATSQPVTIAPPQVKPAATQTISSPAPAGGASKYGLPFEPEPYETFEAYRERAQKAKKMQPGNAEDFYDIMRKLGVPTPDAIPRALPPAAQAPTATARAGGNASTLSEWYAANGKPLPSIGDRSVIYEKAGLGKASFYTGTAEQNTKLLEALKAGKA